MKTDEHEYVKGTQKDHSMSFKLAVAERVIGY